MHDHAIDVADRLSDLNACIDFLDQAGKLIRVRSEVDPVFELAGIAPATANPVNASRPALSRQSSTRVAPPWVIRISPACSSLFSASRTA